MIISIYRHIVIHYKYRLKHCRECYTKTKARGNKAKMANIARGEAECYISIEAECFFLYSTSKAML